MEPVVDVAAAQIVVFQIVGMFPDIQRKHRVETEGERIVLIWKGNDPKCAVRGCSKPGIAESELSENGRRNDKVSSF